MSAHAMYADHGDGVVFVTGATGLLGADLVRRWASSGATRRIAVLVRDRARWQLAAHRAGIPHGAVIAVDGDVTAEGLGMSRDVRHWLARDTTAVVHLAADTTFSRSLDQARHVNRDGTAHLLALAADWPRVTRVAFVSTAFVAGRRTGLIARVARRRGDGGDRLGECLRALQDRSGVARVCGTQRLGDPPLEHDRLR